MWSTQTCAAQTCAAQIIFAAYHVLYYRLKHLPIHFIVLTLKSINSIIHFLLTMSPFWVLHNEAFELKSFIINHLLDPEDSAEGF